MRIVAALCWYEEPVHFLERLVRSLDGVVDELIAHDGPWKHFPRQSLESPPEQKAALLSTAHEIGLPVTTITPTEVYESQVEKRAYLYDFAAQRSDWVFVVDGDEEVIHVDEGFRSKLEATLLFDVGIIACQRISGYRDTERTPRRVFRSSCGLSVRETHNGVVTDDGRWLAGPRRIKKEPTLDLTENLRIRHEAMSRGERRNLWSRRYYQTRARDRIEVH